MGKENDFNEKLGEETKEEKEKRLELQRSLMGGEEEEEDDVNINVNDEASAIRRKYMQKHKEKRKSKTSRGLVGIYFKEKHKAALDEIQKIYGRGKKSEVVDDAVHLLLSDAYPEILEKMEKKYPDS